MVYIFLDVDGVLNNKFHYKKLHKKYGGRFNMQNMPFNPRSLKNLHRIVKKYDAKIILSSSWRHSDKCMTVLEARLIEYGMKIHDKTFTFESLSTRGEEIAAWCAEYARPGDKILIIDDKLYDLEKHFNMTGILKVNRYKGLTFGKMLEGIRKLYEQQPMK